MDTMQLFSSELVSKVELVKKLLKEDSSVNITAGEYLILTCLYTCNDDVERTKEKIITYFQYKKRFPRLMKVVDMLDDYIVSLCRKSILITDINQEQLKAPLVLMINLSNERIRQHGLIVVTNVGEMPFSILFQFTPKCLYETLKCQLFAGGDLLKKIIIINAGRIVAVTVRIARQMLPKNINEMTVVHSGSWDCLKDEIPSESLPIEYDGSNGTIEECNDHLLSFMTKWRDVNLNHF
ncbi:hypothetical protein CHUAL_002843 [Chamberlinius hualienensis]